METFTLRIPQQWVGEVDSARVRAWLASYLQRPHPMPVDPGPGVGRTSLSLPRRPVRVLAALLDCAPSSALRRLIASHLGYLHAVAAVKVMPGAQETRLRSENPSSNRLDAVPATAQRVVSPPGAVGVSLRTALGAMPAVVGDPGNSIPWRPARLTFRSQTARSLARDAGLKWREKLFVFCLALGFVLFLIGISFLLTRAGRWLDLVFAGSATAAGATGAASVPAAVYKPWVPVR